MEYMIFINNFLLFLTIKTVIISLPDDTENFYTPCMEFYIIDFSSIIHNNRMINKELKVFTSHTHYIVVRKKNLNLKE